MIKDRLAIMAELKNYASPKARLTRILKSGKLIQIRRGLFIDTVKNDYSIKTLANAIYGPSYISFEYALAYHGFIPERVETITSAAYNKNKNKTFNTPFGQFLYYYLPSAVYPYGIIKQEEGGHSFLIASAEKAMCDILYKVKNIPSLKTLRNFIMDDLRIDLDKLLTLDLETVKFLAPMYKRKTDKLLIRFLEQVNKNA